MTREEMVEKLAGLETDAKDKSSKYNELIQDEKPSDAAKVRGDIADVIDEYNGLAKKLAYLDCSTAEDPMRFAIEKLTYTVIFAKDENREGVTVPVLVVDEKERPIDLRDLNSFFKERKIAFGKDPKWVYMIEKLNCLFTADIATGLGIDPKAINDSFDMAEVSKEIDLGKTPTSKTKLLKTLNMIMAAMLGDGFKANTHDIFFLHTTYAKKSRKALSVTCANNKALTQIIAEICHRVVLNKVYAVEYKTKK